MATFTVTEARAVGGGSCQLTIRVVETGKEGLDTSEIVVAGKLGKLPAGVREGEVRDDGVAYLADHDSLDALNAAIDAVRAERGLIRSVRLLAMDVAAFSTTLNVASGTSPEDATVAISAHVAAERAGRQQHADAEAAASKFIGVAGAV